MSKESNLKGQFMKDRVKPAVEEMKEDKIQKKLEMERRIGILLER